MTNIIFQQALPFSLVAGLVGLAAAWGLILWIKGQPDGNDRMREVAAAIKKVPPPTSTVSSKPFPESPYFSSSRSATLKIFPQASASLSVPPVVWSPVSLACASP